METVVFFVLKIIFIIILAGILLVRFLELFLIVVYDVELKGMGVYDLELRRALGARDYFAFFEFVGI